MTFRETLWRALRVKLCGFVAIAILTVCYFDLGGAAHLPTERHHDEKVTCTIVPSFYANGACDDDPRT